MGVTNIDIFRCTERIYKSIETNRELIETYDNKKSEIRKLLPLLPVKINERTLDRAVALFPHLSRTFLILTHVYPLQKNSVSYTTAASINLLGVVLWAKFFKKTNVPEPSSNPRVFELEWIQRICSVLYYKILFMCIIGEFDISKNLKFLLINFNITYVQMLC